MTEDTALETPVPSLSADWFDPLEAGVRQQIRGFIEQMLEEELTTVLSRTRYERRQGSTGYRNGHRERQLIGTFGAVQIAVPRARVSGADGRSAEWHSQVLPAYKRITGRAEQLIAGAYLAGANTRRVRRALSGLFGGAISKDTVSRAWHKVQADWQAWQRRDLSDEGVVRLILDGTVVRVRLDRKSTCLSILVALGVQRDGQKVLLALRNMGGESEAAWRALLDDLVGRGLGAPELLIVDGSPGLAKAATALWPEVPVQRCTVHKHRNLLAHAPKRLYEDITADYTEMVYAETTAEVRRKRKTFLAKWRTKCPAVADSLLEAGEQLFTFARFPTTQWRSIRTTNAIERLHGEFKRRIKTQCLLPCADTACMLFWALLASGQVTLRKVDGWHTLANAPGSPLLDLAA